MQTMTAFKILTADQWVSFEAAGTFAGAPVDIADGYIHLSTAEQLEETLAKHFAEQENLTIVEIDLMALGHTVRWETSRGGQLFPHLYSALEATAATAVIALPLGGNGVPLIPEEIAP